MSTLEAFMRAIHDAAVVVPRSDLGVIDVAGDDRIAWLNGMVTSDVKRLAPGIAQPSLVVTQKGKVVADLLVVDRGDRLALVVPAETRDALFDALDRYVVMEDVVLSRVDDTVAKAYGPAAAAIAGEGIVSFSCDEADVPSRLLICTPDVVLRPNATFDVAGVEAWEAWRIERGVPRFGHDFDGSNYPQEASLEKRAVAFDKGCYVGQEVVFMLEVRGHVKRKIARVRIDGDGVPKVGARVFDATGADVGTLSSVARGPISGAIVGLAMLKLACVEVGTSLSIDGRVARVTA